MLENVNKLRVSQIQRLCVHDGPGVRTTVFLKGCYLNCPWCCNPETIYYDKDLLFDKGQCERDGSKSICKACELCGGERLKISCPLEAYEASFIDYSCEELYELLIRDKNLYSDGGGVTFSGGEPLMQAKELLPLLMHLKEDGVHIAFETTLFAPTENWESIGGLVDFWYVDLKLQYGFCKNLDCTLEEGVFYQNLEQLQSSGKTVVYRMVVMNEILKSHDRMEQIVDSLVGLNVHEIELLQYHKLGKAKYKQLGRKFNEFSSPENGLLNDFRMKLRNQDINSVSLHI